MHEWDRTASCSPLTSTTTSPLADGGMIITVLWPDFDAALLSDSPRYFLMRLLATERFRSFEISKPIGNGFHPAPFFLPLEL